LMYRPTIKGVLEILVGSNSNDPKKINFAFNDVRSFRRLLNKMVG
jgi:hypothetical protein